MRKTTNDACFLSLFDKSIKIVCICLAFCFTCQGCLGIKIRERKKCNKKIIEIESKLYKIVLVPEIARLPLSYFFKLTGHEEFIMPHSLETPNKGFVYYGGVIDSIPWVSGKVGEKRLQNKGYLYSSPWSYKFEKDKNSVWFDGSTSFDYNDPATGEKATLLFKKRITGYADSTRLKMDYLIENIGDTNARFTFCMHSRTGVAKWDKGDYFYAPGKDCYVYYMNNMPHLEKRGINPPCWTKWPLMEATEFRPQKESRYIFAYIPAHWCVVGDEKYKENLFFISSPVELPSGKDIMKMGIFMTNGGYVIEPSLTYSISGNPGSWGKPGSTLTLKAKEKCMFTINLVAYQGIHKKEMPEIYAVYPEYILLSKPKCVWYAERFKLQGKIAFSGKGKLVIKTDGKLLKKRKTKPGIFDLGNIGMLSCKNKGRVSICYETYSGCRELYCF